MEEDDGVEVEALNPLQACARHLGIDERGVIFRSLLVMQQAGHFTPEEVEVAVDVLYGEYIKDHTVQDFTHYYCEYVLAGGRP